jgi:hypothetical protein
VEPGSSRQCDTFVVGCFDDILIGLETYADTIASHYQIELPKIPNGYCTWYSNPHGGAASAQAIDELSAFCEKEMTKFGFDTIQIDDNWQGNPRPEPNEGPASDFTGHDPKGPYPNGMKPSAKTIASRGMRPGLWLMPFAWDPHISALKDRQHYFTKKPDGSIYYVTWAGWCLDMTNSETQQFLHKAIHRITQDWGYKYLKLDGLWSGAALKIRYFNQHGQQYGPDDIGTAVFHDPNMTHIQAYRKGLDVVRDAAGDDVYMLGCSISQNMRTLGGSIGKVDGMRIGHDINAQWNSILSCAQICSRLYFLHNRVWHNDPDCLMLRKPLTLDQAQVWGTWIALSGQLNMVSEWLPGLPRERLEVVIRSMPNTGLCGRPIDLFENDPPRIWHLTHQYKSCHYNVVGMFNWSDQPANLTLDLAELKLQGWAYGKWYVGFDFWANRFVEPFTDKLMMKLPPSSCRSIAIKPMTNIPQLVSTSRHISQGMVDVLAVAWDNETKTLSGTSDFVSGDPYELRVYCPEDFTAKSAHAEITKKVSPRIKIKQDRCQVRVTIISSANQRVKWRVEFED